LNNSTQEKEIQIRRLFETARTLFPNAECELNFRNVYELSVAVILSAQTTDPSVNKVTPAVFKAYPDAKHLAQAELVTLESMIRTLGLYHTKAKHLIDFASDVLTKFEGKIPSDFDQLQTLPGIGRKTANVIVSVGFNQPGLAVDTHVLRVSQRFGVVENEADPILVEMTLKNALDEKEWSEAHHALLFFGRYHCMARNPKCEICPLKLECRYKKMNF
jgi:endonuclease III